MLAKYEYFIVALNRTWTHAESLDNFLDVTIIRRSFSIDAKIDSMELMPHAL